jgi:hypothetical protein
MGMTAAIPAPHRIITRRYLQCGTCGQETQEIDWLWPGLPADAEVWLNNHCSRCGLDSDVGCQCFGGGTPCGTDESPKMDAPKIHAKPGSDFASSFEAEGSEPG